MKYRSGQRDAQSLQGKTLKAACTKQLMPGHSCSGNTYLPMHLKMLLKTCRLAVP